MADEPAPGVAQTPTLAPVDATEPQLVLNNVKGMKKLTATKATVSLNKVEAQQSTIEESVINANSFESQKLELKKSRAVIVDGDMQQATFDDSAVHVEASDLQETKVTKGSLCSRGNSYQSLTMDGGTIDSFGDEAKGECKLTGLIGPNEIRKFKAQGDMTIEGESAASADLIGVDISAQKLEIKTFGMLQLSDMEPNELTIKESINVFVIDSSLTKFTGESLKLLSLDGDVQEATLKSVEFGATKDIKKLSVSDSVIKDENSRITEVKDSIIIPVESVITKITESLALGMDATFEEVDRSQIMMRQGTITKAETSQLITMGSTITKATGSLILAKDGEVTADDCHVLSDGATVTAASGALVVANAGSVTNTNGFTIGKGITKTLSSVAIVSDGTDLDLWNALGDVNLDILVGDFNVTMGGT